MTIKCIRVLGSQINEFEILEGLTMILNNDNSSVTQKAVSLLVAIHFMRVACLKQHSCANEVIIFQRKKQSFDRWENVKRTKKKHLIQEERFRFVFW